MVALYLLDANVLIDANRDYYPIERVPQFWAWLLEMAKSGRVKVPREVYDKVVNAQTDVLSKWLVANREVIILDESVPVELVQQVINQRYAADLTDVEHGKLNEDPFLVAYALADIANRHIVTTEISKPTKTRANRHIPDVCHYPNFNVLCINTFRMIRDLDFRTG